MPINLEDLKPIVSPKYKENVKEMQNEMEERFKQLLVKEKALKKITCICGETVFEDGVSVSNLTGTYYYSTYTCTKCNKKWWVRINV